MPQVKPDVEAFARIKVLGVGGSGGNAIDHMINSKVKGVDFVVINTDAQDLHHSQAKKKIHIGKNLTKGLGAGMNPEVGHKAAEETREEIQETLKNSDMVFLAAGLGGGTGSGAMPSVASISKESGNLTVAVVTKPFAFEGKQRMAIAEKALEELRHVVDAIIIIPNDRLLQTIDKQTTARSAFAMCDEVLKQAVEGISDLITNPGMINIDFADIRAVMENAGSALMGIGTSSGEKRAEEAAKMAINSPLLELSIAGAKGVLFSIAGGDDMTMFEIQEAAKVITESVDSNARIIFGTVTDGKLKKNEIKVTVIATGFPDKEMKKILYENNQTPMQNGTEHTTTASSDATEKAPTKTEDEKEKGSIFNSLPLSKKESKTKEEPAKKVVAEDEDDDWGAVPQFLRRSKLK